MIPIDMARDPTGSKSTTGLTGSTAEPGYPLNWTLFYDAGCGFCRWSLAHLLALDRERRVRPVALDTPAADALLADLTPEQRARSWHLVAPEGRRFSAGSAAPPLLRLLAGGRIPAALLASVPKPTERAYRWVADHRAGLSKAIPARAKARASERIARH